MEVVLEMDVIDILFGARQSLTSHETLVIYTNI